MIVALLGAIEVPAHAGLHQMDCSWRGETSNIADGYWFKQSSQAGIVKISNIGRARVTRKFQFNDASDGLKIIDSATALLENPNQKFDPIELDGITKKAQSLLLEGAERPVVIGVDQFVDEPGCRIYSYERELTFSKLSIKEKNKKTISVPGAIRFECHSHFDQCR